MIQDDPILKKNKKDFNQSMIDFEKASKKRKDALKKLEEEKSNRQRRNTRVYGDV